MEDKFLNGRGLKEYTTKVKEKMAFIEDPTVDGVPPSLIDFFYPVGSYYETSNSSFNPNATWGGTWVKDSVGRVTVSLDASQTEFNTVGKTGGEKTHKLTIAELAKHTHTYKNSDDPTGVTIYDVRMATTFSNTGSLVYGGNGGTYDSSTGVGKTGSDTPHNNLQPYVVVIRWHRTA